MQDTTRSASCLLNPVNGQSAPVYPQVLLAPFYHCTKDNVTGIEIQKDVFTLQKWGRNQLNPAAVPNLLT
jgi:hypothetical protein